MAAHALLVDKNRTSSRRATLRRKVEGGVKVRKQIRYLHGTQRRDLLALRLEFGPHLRTVIPHLRRKQRRRPRLHRRSREVRSAIAAESIHGMALETSFVCQDTR